MPTWFSADLHLGHANIIRYSKRPFASVEEMDAALIANWNARVQPKDEVWVLGDFAFGGPDNATRYMERLRGRKHLIHGNHDRPATRVLPGWASSQAMAEIKLDGARIVLCHYGMRVWNACHHGSLHLYGHSHGTLPGDRQSLDVGVDCWDFRPVSLSEIRARLATLPERRAPDRHGASL